MKSAKPKIRRKKNRSTYAMNFVTSLKRSGSVQIKRTLVPLSSSATVSGINSDSQFVESMVDHNSEPTCPNAIGDCYFVRNW